MIKTNHFSKMRNFFIAGLCMLLLAAGLNEQALACTDVILNNSDFVVSGRTMDFSIDLKAEVCAVPRNQVYQGTLPSGFKGRRWVSKYGFVGIKSLGVTYSDGLNSKGLSFSVQNLNESTYPEPPAKPEPNFVMLNGVTFWVLGNFATVKEVKEAFRTNHIYRSKLAKTHHEFFHFSVHDAKGNSLVIEFIDGKVKMYCNNKYKVLTNSPPFDWHVNNLRNYVNLTDKWKDGTCLGIQSIGFGSGMLGLPGDVTSPSRFLQAFFLNHFAWKSLTVRQAVSNVLHILNNVQVANGEALGPDNGIDPPLWDYTQWTAVRDHTNLVLYFRDNQNSNLREINLNELDFSPGQPIKSMPLAGGDWFKNVNDQLKPVKNK